MQKIYRNLGISYKGSKSKIAEKIVGLLPRAEHFYDLFAGGCAISHCALLKNKYQHIHINDINPMMPKAFIKALQGGFDDEDRWISREDFFRLKDTDPYVAICFSFGNDLKTYCYGKDVEPLKKALHYAIFFDSYELSDTLIGVDLRPIQKCATRQEKYLLAKRLIKAAYSNNNTPPNARKLPKTQTHTDCQVTKGRNGHKRLLFKKKLDTARLAELGTAQTSTGFKVDSTGQLHIQQQSYEILHRLQTITPPYNEWNWKTKKGCLGLRVYRTQARCVI